MKTFYTILSLLFSGFLWTAAAQDAQNQWPKTIRSGGQVIKIYQWQPESFSDGQLHANAAISIRENEKDEPVFGMIWLTASADDDGRQVKVRSVEVTDIKLPEESGQDQLADIRTAIAGNMSQWNLSLASEDVNSSVKLNQEAQGLSATFNNNPPKIIYADRPSLLVIIDGTPKLQKNSDWGVETVVNTPFTIVKYNNRFYLYGGKHWYAAPSATGSYALTTEVPATLGKIESAIAQANQQNNVQQEDNDHTIYNIIVSTEPAELLQSNGEPDFTPIPGTNLLYVRNSGNDIFMDISSQQYFVLLSGRWYKSQALSGQWRYVASDKLPADFAKIPEGSPKDNVLASVAGTLAAKDAVMEAQVPQTAKVDRNNANADIQYDGDPRFESIDGTDMAYAVNSPDYVIRWRGMYYAVENGVWFESHSAYGPWRVSIERPYAVALIPPRYPVYAMKYVYIYDVTPDYVYMGYSRGYLNSFIYGPTVVYGTGYYYRPWYGRYYYARPYTWGFNVHYNPWIGWGFGFNYTAGWFNMGVGMYSPWGWGGWWGPAVYRPAYTWMPYHAGYRVGYYGYSSPYYGRGYAGRNTVIINNTVNIYRTNNIYNYRSDVVTVDNRRSVVYNNNPASRPARGLDNAGSPGRSPATAPSNLQERRDAAVNRLQGNNGAGRSSTPVFENGFNSVVSPNERLGNNNSSGGTNNSGSGSQPALRPGAVNTPSAPRTQSGSVSPNERLSPNSSSGRTNNSGSGSQPALRPGAVNTPSAPRTQSGSVSPNERLSPNSSSGRTNNSGSGSQPALRPGAVNTPSAPRTQSSEAVRPSGALSPQRSLPAARPERAAPAAPAQAPQAPAQRLQPARSSAAPSQSAPAQRMQPSRSYSAPSSAPAPRVAPGGNRPTGTLSVPSRPSGGNSRPAPGRELRN